MDASCKGCNVQTAPASPPPQMVMTMAMPQSPPLSPTGSTVELLEHETSKGDWKGTDNCCCCCEKGGNKLTLTDKRVIVKYWENCMPGCAGCRPHPTSRVRTLGVCVCVCVCVGGVLERSLSSHLLRDSHLPHVARWCLGCVASQLLRVEHAGGVL